ncbi:hypothetical protein NHP21005_10200 [Helicobacter sp. NHP21005]|uniref:transcriptional regulator n=1 Tax=Helicobacter felistomachi TaxID=3040201 RepID=UPI002572D17F|nr:transcriptional regulator [Helicobacter sp. NHP21005]BEG57332.1 hypothetical protein NHP21005_10200 [Helicobacter sp. NHP21005]
MQKYILKSKNTNVLSFSVDKAQKNLDIATLEVLAPRLLPISLQGAGKQNLKEHLIKWIKARQIPKHRQFMPEILNTLGADINDPLSYAKVGLALSLNDSFWIVPSGSNYLWQDFNLYDHPFNTAVSLTALTGQSTETKLPTSGLKLSPELTTNGMLKKCWHKDTTGEIILIKGQIGTESYSEHYIAQVAKAMGLNALFYDLDKQHGEIVCTCKLFTSEQIGFVPILECIDYPKYQRLQHDPKARLCMLAQVLGQEFVEDLLLFDALVFNTDRHLGNFGMLLDNDTNTFAKPAPIFDNGMAFLGQMSESELDNIPAFFASVDSALDLKFDTQIKLVVRPRHIPLLERLKDFTFTHHSQYNLPEKWLRAGETMLRVRGQEIIKTIKGV